MQQPASLLIAAIRRRLKQVVGAEVRPYGLSPTQFWVLNRIHEGEGSSLRELAEALHMDQPTASRVVAALARQKLVRMEDDPEDRRRGRIVMTTKGRALGQKLHPLALHIRAAVDAALSPSERETLRALLAKALLHVSKL